MEAEPSSEKDFSYHEHIEHAADNGNFQAAQNSNPDNEDVEILTVS